MKILLILVLFFGLYTLPVLAHPGNTASDGCHYCRTNCAKWGEIEGARHCHNAKSTTISSNTQQTSKSLQSDSDNSWLYIVVFIVGAIAVSKFVNENK